MLLQDANNAASLSVAEKYVEAFSNLAKETNTVILPSSAGDASSMVTQVCALLIQTILLVLVNV